MKRKEIKQYLYQVKSFIPQDYPEKKQFLAGLEFKISKYISDRPNATINDIYEIFGTPQSVAEKCGFVRSASGGKVKLPMVKYVFWLIVFLIAVVIILVFVFGLDEYLTDFIEKLCRLESIPRFKQISR